MSVQESNFRGAYKKRNLFFGENDGKRVLRAEKINDDRKNRRRNEFLSRRRISEDRSVMRDNANIETPVLKEVQRNTDRLAALKQWKKEKEDKLRLLKKIEKPVFKVSVVKHKVYSPPACYCNKENCKSELCADSKLKVKNEYKLMNSAFSQMSSKPKEMSSSTKKTLPIVDSGIVKRLQMELDSFQKSVSASLPTSAGPSAAVKKTKKLKFTTPLTPRTPKHISSSSKMQVLPKVDSGRVKQRGPQTETDRATPLAAPLHLAENYSGKDKVKLEGTTFQSDSSNIQNVPSQNIRGSRSPVSDKNQVASIAVEKVIVPVKSFVEMSTSPIVKWELNKTQFGETSNKALEDGTKLEEEDEDYPAMHSPYITRTRGKNRSDAKKKDYNSPGVFSSIPTRYLQKLSDMLSEMDEKDMVGAKYFRFKLKMELGMLYSLCDYWTAVQKLKESSIEDFQGLIDSAVGQSKLLIANKMAQFETLIADCEKESGEKPVTVDDLQGFWDVMNIQVVDVRKRFQALDELYLSGGQKLHPSVEKKSQKPFRGKKIAKNSKPKAEVKSSMRAVIAAAREKQKEDSSANPDTHDPSPKTEDITEVVPITPLRSSRRAKSASLHQQVLLRESQRKTVTWDTTSKLTPSVDIEESLSLPVNKTTPRTALKKTSLPRKLGKSAEVAKDVHFEEETKTEPEISSKQEYSLTPYVRKSRSSRYSNNREKMQVLDCIMSFESPVQEPARVRRSKRLGSMGLK